MRRSAGLTAAIGGRSAGVLERSASAAVAVGCALPAAWVAAHHPLSPAVACVLAAAWFVACWRWPLLWLAGVPALLPIADLSPWTGWIAVDEFDILLLATLAAGHARRAWHGDAASPGAWLAMAAGLALFCVPGLSIGLHDAGRSIGGFGAAFGAWFDGWFGGYADPINTLRVAKSAVFALALLPMIDDALHADSSRAAHWLGRGILVGLVAVCAMVVWERVAYPGLLDTSQAYRTTAAFWEMHVGGAAIDGYLALATPFAAWALWSARGRARWLVAAGLSLAVGYACLTTFSRGVYGAVLLPLLLLGGWLKARHWLSRRRLRTLGTVLLICLIAGETLAVLTPDSFMSKRMNRSQRDYESRVVHWARGLALPRSTAERWFGIGLGRLPARYGGTSAEGEFSGAARWVPADGRGAVRIEGPHASGGPAGRLAGRIGGLFGLTQQVPPSARYRLRIDYRTATGIELYARVCQSHLLYDGDCQYLLMPLTPDGDRWHRLDTNFEGAPLEWQGPWQPHGAVLTLAVANPGGRAEFDRVALIDSAGHDVVVNGGFDHDPARWWPAAQFYFLPWHIDNLYLELLIERGRVGLLIGVGGLLLTLRRLMRLSSAGTPIAPFIAAAVLGAVIVGAVSSLLDAPRTAFLLSLLIAVAWRLRNPPTPVDARRAMP